MARTDLLERAPSRSFHRIRRNERRLRVSDRIGRPRPDARPQRHRHRRYLDPPPIAKRAVDEQLALTARLRHATGLQSEIVILNGARLAIPGRAISERIVIFSRDEPARVSYESCTHREFLDFQIHADRLDRELLRRIVAGMR